ncbi:MAG: PhzF family phenazine biosynthesis protein [Bacteroidota bacterium]|nr:PhzF family phenazine biosynthesis protein [Bacteroidota bacterium]
MAIPIYQVDAFAENIFEGNPAAVVPLDHWLQDKEMQQVAMENNLSDTAFFVKNDSPEEGFHLRWFTPEYEIDLCGHATLASAYVIKNFIEPHIQDIIFTTEKAGILKASVKDAVYTLNFPSRNPEPCEVPGKLLSSLGISTAVEILKSRDYFVVLPNEEAVLNVEPDFNLMKELDTIGVIVTAKGHKADVVSRCFYPGAGIPEDPVTGSAHCNIIPYWAEKLNKTKLYCRQASARGGDLHCELVNDRVLLSGKCILYMKGEIYSNS